MSFLFSFPQNPEIQVRGKIIMSETGMCRKIIRGILDFKSMDPGILVPDFSVFSGPFFKVRIVPFLIVRFLHPHFSFLIVSGVSHILQFSFLRFQIVLLLRSSRSPCSLLMTKIRMNCQKIVFLFFDASDFCLSSAPATAFSSSPPIHLIREDLFYISL